MQLNSQLISTSGELKKKIALLEWDLQNMKDGELKNWKIQQLKMFRDELTNSFENTHELKGDET